MVTMAGDDDPERGAEDVPTGTVASSGAEGDGEIGEDEGAGWGGSDAADRGDAS